MIFLIAFIVVSVIAIIVCVKSENRDIEDCIPVVASMFVVAALFNGIIGLCVNLDATTPINRTEVVETKYISAFQDTSNYIFHTNSGYRYIEKTEKGLTIKTFNPSRIYFPENFDGTARIEIYDCEFKNSNMIWWTLVPCKIQEYEVHIPEGSLTTEYKVDLQ